MNKKVTNLTIKKMKGEGTPISMITAYDYVMAQNVDEAGIDMILVGDSLGNVVMGHTSTLPVTMGRYGPSYGSCRPRDEKGFGRRRHALHELSGKCLPGPS